MINALKNIIMNKLIISDLWQTGRELLTYENSEFDRPQTFADLKKCDGVLVGDSLWSSKAKEVLINDRLYVVESTTVRHPMGGTMQILEVH
jgi:hypothetical protein